VPSAGHGQTRGLSWDSMPELCIQKQLRCERTNQVVVLAHDAGHYVMLSQVPLDAQPQVALHLERTTIRQLTVWHRSWLVSWVPVA
jgi:hypothetical protein